MLGVIVRMPLPLRFSLINTLFRLPSLTPSLLQALIILSCYYNSLKKGTSNDNNKSNDHEDDDDDDDDREEEMQYDNGNGGENDCVYIAEFVLSLVQARKITLETAHSFFFTLIIKASESDSSSNQKMQDKKDLPKGTISSLRRLIAIAAAMTNEKSTIGVMTNVISAMQGLIRSQCQPMLYESIVAALRSKDIPIALL